MGMMPAVLRALQIFAQLKGKDGYHCFCEKLESPGSPVISTGE